MIAPDWRAQTQVLVPQADAIGMLGVIRSLGRAGYRVHATSVRADAVGLRSNFAARAVQSPAYDDPGFQDWLRRYLRANEIHVIVPSEGFLLATVDMFAELSPLLPLPAEYAVVRRCFSKVETLECYMGASDVPLTQHLPPSLIARTAGDIADENRIARLGSPVYIKADGVLARNGAPGGVWRAGSLAQVRERVESLLDDYEAVLLQGHVDGCKATVNFCLHDRKVLAESMCLASHESPHHGGLTVLRKTWWHQGMRDDALARLQALNYDGVAMVEYKWDARSQTYDFVEANTRYWAALHLDLFAATDFPRIQVDAFLGHHDETVTRQPLGVRARHTVPGEVGYVISSWRDAELNLSTRLLRLAEFFLLFLHPGIHADLLFPGDRKLYWYQWRRFVADLFRQDAD